MTVTPPPPPRQIGRRLPSTIQPNVVRGVGRHKRAGRPFRPNRDTLAIDLVSSPANGAAAIVGTTVRYTPAAGYFGPDSFSYTASDGRGGTASANVAITVAAPPSVHVADIDAFTSKNSKMVAPMRVYAKSQSGTLLQNVVVNGSWGNRSWAGLHRTKTVRLCEMSVTAIKLTVAARTYTIDNLSSSGRVYLPSGEPRSGHRQRAHRHRGATALRRFSLPPGAQSRRAGRQCWRPISPQGG